jgi:processive 1,2-diacylglycerol beta-glucosyltransferase
MKILLLHASAGAGHRRAAEALSKAFRQLRPDAEVTVCDILDYTTGIFRKTYSAGYLDLVRKAPELWGYLYSEADRKAAVPWRKEMRAFFNKLNTLVFLKFYRQYDPDIAVCTHFMPLQLLTRASRRRRRRARVYCAVTDFAVHALWVLENTDAYYVATEEARRHLIRRGEPADRVTVTGIPIDPVFEQQQSPAEALKTLGLPADLPVVLLLSGGFGVGPTLDLIRAFGQETPVCRLVVVAGANERLKQEAEALAATIRTPVVVYGYVGNIHVMMDACDLVISKPGGLTTSEVLAKGRPLLVIDPIPGQEQRNCETVLEAGAAARLFEVEDAYFKVRSLLLDRELLAQMSGRAQRLGRPGAAAAIAADILGRQAAVGRR